MAKKDRLGADPLSWIGDSSQDSKSSEEKTESKPAQKVEPKAAEPVNTEPKADVKAEPVKQEPKAESPKEPEPKVVKPEPEKTSSQKSAPKVETGLQNASKALLQKNRDVKQDAKGSSVKKNLELEGKYLTFVLAGEDYGIEITKVKEIMGLLPITRVPRTKRFIKGVINLRGKIVSVVDMRLKFLMEEIEATQETCIIVVQTRLGEKGIIVDKVSEVLNIAADDIESVPAFGTNIDTDYILGMAKVDSSVKILLDIEKILSNVNKTIQVQTA